MRKIDMRRMVWTVTGICCWVAAAGVPLSFPDAADGTVTIAPDGTQELEHRLSNPAALASGRLYGFSYAGRTVGRGLLLAGSRDVNVDHSCPDENWYDFAQAFRSAGAAGEPAHAERFHFGHYRGKGEFSFRGARCVPLVAEYVRTADGLVLGHGESVVGTRYEFYTAFGSFARNESRPLLYYRNATFNTQHWNVSASSEIVYRHDLAGRHFQSGTVALRSVHYTGRAGMAVEASADGTHWVALGSVTNVGSYAFTCPAALFPATNLCVRFTGVPGTSLQIHQYALDATLAERGLAAYGGSVYRDAETGAVLGRVKPPTFGEAIASANAQRLAETAEAAVWGAVSDVKVFRTTPVPTVSAKGLAVSLAANESESVQLVVRAREEPLADVRVTAGELVAANGKDVLPARAVEIRRVGYVTVRTPTDDAGAPGDWPDPLLPQDAHPLTVAARDNQPFWITVRTEKRTKPGTYAGTVCVSYAVGGRTVRQTVPLAVEVWNFALPDRLTCESAYGFSPHRVADYHRVKPGSAEHDRLLEAYLTLFADYRLTVYHWGKGEMPSVTWRNAKDPEKAEPVFDWLLFDDAVTEMRGRFNHNALRVGVTGLGRGFQKQFVPGVICGVPQTNAWYQPLMGRYLGAIESHLKQKGWLDSSYVYWFDEPNPSVIEEVRQGMLTLKRHAPGLRRMLTYPATDALDGAVNLWNPRLDGFYKNDSEAVRARGESAFWWYVCCGPHAPYPTEFIDHAGHELRTWLWMTWGAGVKGTLVWETSFWSSRSRYPDKSCPQDPYADPMAWNGKGGTWGNGDGRFVYPPVAACITPRKADDPPVLDAPNPSYRLAILRDGLEDYEYFAQLKRVDPTNSLLKVPETVYRKLNDFSDDPAAMHAHRARLAREIVRLGGGVARTPPRPCVSQWYDGVASSYRADKWRKIRHEEKLAEIAAHGGRVYDLVLLGDSITELWQWAAPRYGTNVYARMAAEMDVLNLGYGGDGIGQVCARIERGELDGYAAKNVAVMIGTNDKGCRPEDMAEGMKRLLDLIRLKQPAAKIALYAIFPCGQTWRHLRNQSANRLYAELADNRTVFFRNINARLPLALMPDGLHPNEAGYAVWFDDLRDFCRPAARADGTFAANGCTAKWEGRTLTVGNALFSRTYAVRGGRLRTVSFKATNGVDWQQAKKTADAGAPLNVVAAKAKWSPVGVEGLRLTVTADGRTTEINLYPGMPGVIVRSSEKVESQPAHDLDRDFMDRKTWHDALSKTLAQCDTLDYGTAHVKLTSMICADQTDGRDNLLYVDERMLMGYDWLYSVGASLLDCRDVIGGDGLAFVRLAPMPGSRPGRPDDFIVNGAGHYLAAIPNGYPLAELVYRGGEAGRQRALVAFQRALRPYRPGRDGVLLSNTWGAGNRDSRICQDFLLKEIDAGAKLGVDVIQIDDGWQHGRTANSQKTANPGRKKVWSGYWAADPDFWKEDRERFPDGLDLLVAKAKEKGMRFGLWFGPDSSDEAANWQRDADCLLDYHRRLGIDYFKMDSMKLRTEKSFQRNRMMFDRMLELSDGAMVFDLDCTAEVRPGFLGLIDIGPMFVENRYTRRRVYLPHHTLKNLWDLSHVIDPVRLRLEFNNPDTNHEIYGDDPLSHAKYRPDALFATVMAASPLAWMELSDISDASMAQLAPLVRRWKAERARWHGGVIHPVAGRPDGVAWTGFVSEAADGTGGYALLFRELNAKDSYALDLEPIFGARTPTAVETLGGRGTAQSACGTLRVTIPEKLDYLWLKFDMPGMR